MRNAVILAMLFISVFTSCENDSEVENYDLRPTIIVDATTINRVVDKTPLGINYNFLADANQLRPEGARTIQESTKDLGVSMVRYPGGEKSDFHLFSLPPYERSDPQAFGWYAEQCTPENRLDFDTYMSYVIELGIEPYIVTVFDPIRNESLHPNLFTVESSAEHAAAWVNYANNVKGYNIKYWEIGNENYTGKSGMKDDPDFVGESVKAIAQAMKKQDPNIKIGCSTNGDTWSRIMLNHASDYLSFLNMSHYVTYDSYDNYLAKQGDYSLVKGKLTGAYNLISSSTYGDAEKEVFVSETGVLRMGHKTNSIANAIIIADLLGDLMSTDYVSHIMQWSTRWIGGDSDSSFFYVLDEYNKITTTGQPLRIYNNLVKDRFGRIRLGSKPPKNIRVYATYSSQSGDMVLFVLNKGTTSYTTDFSFANTIDFVKSEMFSLVGNSKTDINPVWNTSSQDYRDNRLFDVELPGYSINVIKLNSTLDLSGFRPDKPEIQN